VVGMELAAHFGIHGANEAEEQGMEMLAGSEAGGIEDSGKRLRTRLCGMAITNFEF